MNRNNMENEMEGMDRNEVNLSGDDETNDPALLLRELEPARERLRELERGLERLRELERADELELEQLAREPERLFGRAILPQSVFTDRQSARYPATLPAILGRNGRLILSSVGSIPDDFIWKVLLTCLGIQHYLMIQFNSQIDIDLLLAAEPMSMGKAFHKFFVEMAFTMLFLHFSLLYFLLVWKWERMILKYFYILAWLTIPILSIPPLLSKASLVAVTMTWGSFKLSFIPFITLGALVLFIIVLAIILTCLRCGMKSDHIIPPGNAAVPNPFNLALPADNGEGPEGPDQV